jgi:hypothetical protein
MIITPDLIKRANEIIASPLTKPVILFDVLPELRDFFVPDHVYEKDSNAKSIRYLTHLAQLSPPGNGVQRDADQWLRYSDGDQSLCFYCPTLYQTFTLLWKMEHITDRMTPFGSRREFFDHTLDMNPDRRKFAECLTEGNIFVINKIGELDDIARP